MPPYTGDRITYGDKFVHIFLFAGLAYLVFFALSLPRRLNFFGPLFLAGLISFLYAVFCEYIQTFIPGRDSSFWDLAAGFFGIVAGLFIASKQLKSINKNILN